MLAWLERTSRSRSALSFSVNAVPTLFLAKQKLIARVTLLRIALRGTAISVKRLTRRSRF
jgi:hypothetical protein